MVRPELVVIVLAAGKGVRMKSDLPKVFHAVLGRPMLTYVLETVKKLSPFKIFVVVGHQRQLIIAHYKDWPITFVVQEEQMGTGHAVMQVKPYLNGFSGTALVLNGDVPLISEKAVRRLMDFHVKNKAAATDLTAELPDAGGYGRIVRGENGEITKIVEKKDASPAELKIKEINTGTFCFDKEALFSALSKIRADNAQKEYYLTDTVEILKKEGFPVLAFRADDAAETLGVNTREELAAIEQILRSR
ncbi:NTP transferase domain-containing protein [Candidatus Saganbacteria bacterium]|uniref:NTP transferase domain-containing protein n=1 Tax=Candidatus Saganbacteria bacterium TaxID=2575572 RepID=A0A9D6UNF1_UNCSA|nr:NTP transferase domain-containing protein [Candidatus Saganbacteria bacterium]